MFIFFNKHKQIKKKFIEYDAGKIIRPKCNLKNDSVMIFIIISRE